MGFKLHDVRGTVTYTHSFHFLLCMNVVYSVTTLAIVTASIQWIFS